ncbi:MAG: fluoride efflux transporter CrcB [Acidobacteriota bacterium]
MNYLWIAAGAALGGVLRYYFSGVAARLAGETFPWGTLFVNITGCMAIGFFVSLTGPDGRLIVPAHIRLFVMTGLCGGYTTFSTFGLETLRLLQDREWAYAAGNIVSSLLLCLGGVWAGYQAALFLNERL